MRHFWWESCMGRAFLIGFWYSSSCNGIYVSFPPIAWVEVSQRWFNCPQTKIHFSRPFWRIISWKLFNSDEPFSWRKNYKIVNQLIESGAPEKQIYAVGEKASQGLPYSPYPLSKIAQVALHNHWCEYAVKQLKKSIRRTPHRSTFYAGLAQVYEKMGRTDNALTSIEQALLWFPINPKGM